MIFRSALRPAVLAALITVALLGLRQPHSPNRTSTANSCRPTDVERVLNAWEQSSAATKSFYKSFSHFRYDVDLAPPDDPQGPSSIGNGAIQYIAPDKFLYSEYQVQDWHFSPATQRLEKTTRTVGEHWTCDGASLYQVDSDAHCVREYPLPGGRRFTDFLPLAERIPFDVNAKELAERFEINIVTPGDRAGQEIWLQMRARRARSRVLLGPLSLMVAHDADVEVILRSSDYSLTAMRVTYGSCLNDVWVFEELPDWSMNLRSSFTPLGTRVVDRSLVRTYPR